MSERPDVVSTAASGEGVVRSDALLFIHVTSRTKMRPTGRGGPSLTLSRLETKQSELGGLRPGGKILPSLQLDGTTSEPTLDNSVGPTQNVPLELPAERRSDLPISVIRFLFPQVIGTCM